MQNSNNNTRQSSLLFLHIPKAGGSTLNSILEKHFDLESIFRINGVRPQESIDEFRNLPEAKKKKVKFINGHMPFGIHDFLPNQSTYITMLRHPVERIISHYYYVKRRPDHYLHERVMSHNMSLKDYVNSGISLELENYQTRMLSSIGAKKSDENRSSTHMLKIAKRNLSENFAMVGLTEKFDETLILLKNRCGFKNIFYFKKNVTNNRLTKQGLSKDIIQAIEQKNLLDMELYQYAESIFQILIQEEGIKFKLELKSFQILNALYKKYSLIRKQPNKFVISLSRLS